MAVLSSSEYVEVFKFPSTGLVALCQEVAGYVNDPNDHMLDGVDLASAEYVRDKWDNHVIRFKRREEV